MSDEETKIIENYETTTAGTHDSNVCAELISEDAPLKRQIVREKGVKPRIIQRRIRGRKN